MNCSEGVKVSCLEGFLSLGRNIVKGLGTRAILPPLDLLSGLLYILIIEQEAELEVELGDSAKDLVGQELNGL